MAQEAQQSKERVAGNDVRQLDAALLSGGWVIASSERAARFVEALFHRARLSEGLNAWPEPTILTWASFVRRAWDQAQAADDRMVLSAAQELQIWESIAAESKSTATLLPGPRHKLAGLASEAHRLLANYAPSALDRRERCDWQRDAEEMSAWLVAFEERSNRERLLSANLLPLELLKFLHAQSANQYAIEKRPNLRLVGFDRLEPLQQELLTAWGGYELVESDSKAATTDYFEAPDLTAELAGCVLWCNQKLKANSSARLLVISSEVSERRGEIERAFARWLNAEHSPAIEFSLGQPLNRIPLVQAAELLLRWLTGSLREHELDWMLSTGRASQSADETAALQWLMRALRRAKKERPLWSLNEFCHRAAQLTERNHSLESAAPLVRWVAKMRGVQARLREVAGPKLIARKSLLDWSLLLPELLGLAGWPGYRTLTSAEQQARMRFEQTVENLSTLGFDGHRVTWNEFADLISQSLAETLFAPESNDASIMIVGPAESAGLRADGIWFLGAKEGCWPATGATNPLLPIGLQRDAKMPHAAVEVDWELARSVTDRILHSAPEVCFTFARICGDQEAKPSRLIEQTVGSCRLLPPEFIAPVSALSETIFADETRFIPYHLPTVHGGAHLLTLQSNCPFKAFATHRLGAENWSEAEVGLTALQRGNLLHQLMREIWSATEQGGLMGLEDLRKLVAPSSDAPIHEGDLEGFVLKHAQKVLHSELDSELRNRLSPAHLELEVERLTRLVSLWLRYESAREEFEIVDLEANRTVNLEGLALNLRIDRIDRLKDGSLLIIDYKTGDVKPKLWELPRPEDVQLPLYACLAVKREEKDEKVRENVGGLIFAKINSKEQVFAGKVMDAEETIFNGLDNRSALKKNPLSEEMLSQWKKEIEKLAHDFVLGNAEVDPRQPPKTCEKCDLKVLCRVQESGALTEDDSDDDEGVKDE